MEREGQGKPTVRSCVFATRWKEVPLRAVALAKISGTTGMGTGRCRSCTPKTIVQVFIAIISILQKKIAK